MIRFIAQIPPAAVAAATEQANPYGVAGVVLAFFMARDIWQRKRDADRETARDKREAKREEQQAEQTKLQAEQTAKREGKIDEIVDALHDLTRSLNIEVLSRPQAMQWARDESASMLKKIERPASDR